MDGFVIYAAERLGKGGVPFFQYKFRTMKRGAEAEQFTLEERKEMVTYGELESDQRVTVPGRVLRPIHFDEIPQVYNIAMGEMSWVGVRPRPASEWALFPPEHVELVLRHEPGLFGVEYFHRDLRDMQDMMDMHAEYTRQKDIDPRGTDLRYLREILKNRTIQLLTGRTRRGIRPDM